MLLQASDRMGVAIKFAKLENGLKKDATFQCFFLVSCRSDTALQVKVCRLHHGKSESNPQLEITEILT